MNTIDKFVVIDKVSGCVWTGRQFLFGLELAKTYDRLGHASTALGHLRQNRRYKGVESITIMTVRTARAYLDAMLSHLGENGPATPAAVGATAEAASDLPPPLKPDESKPAVEPVAAAQPVAGKGGLTEGGLALEEAISVLNSIREAEQALADAEAEVQRLRDAEAYRDEAQAEVRRQVERWAKYGSTFGEALALITGGAA